MALPSSQRSFLPLELVLVDYRLSSQFFLEGLKLLNYSYLDHRRLAQSIEHL